MFRCQVEKVRAAEPDNKPEPEPEPVKEIVPTDAGIPSLSA